MPRPWRAMAISDKKLAAANARGRKRLRTTPHAVAARYDGERDRIVVELSTGVEVAFPPHDARGLETAKPENLAEIAIDPPASGCTSGGSTRIFTCRRCWKACSA